MDIELGDVIAEREALFAPREGAPHGITVRLGRPVPDPRSPGQAWCCPYQVLGIGRDRVFAMFGVDAMQALLLAVHAIPAELAAYVRTRGGTLLHFEAPDTTWLGSCRTALERAGDVLPVLDSQLDQGRHRVDVRQPAPFLRRIMRELAGDARLSLEGALGDAPFPADAILGREPLDLLKRNTTSPVMDFLVLRLQAELVDGLFSQISRIGLREDIVHVQIEKRGRLELTAYDNFHPEGVVTGPGVPAEILAELEAAGVVRGFTSIDH
jgi:hypothetical protein